MKHLRRFSLIFINLALSFLAPSTVLRVCVERQYGTNYMIVLLLYSFSFLCSVFGSKNFSLKQTRCLIATLDNVDTIFQWTVAMLYSLFLYYNPFFFI